MIEKKLHDINYDPESDRFDCAVDYLGSTVEESGHYTKWPDNVLISVRKAEMSDCRPIFEWRNDPIARSMSRNSNPLDWTEHVKWYRRVLDNSNRPIFIGFTPSQTFGMTRFDMESGKAEVSIVMSSASRGRKIAGRFLSQCIERFINDFGSMPLIAEIKPENVRSVALFQQNGFKLTADNLFTL